MTNAIVVYDTREEWAGVNRKNSARALQIVTGDKSNIASYFLEQIKHMSSWWFLMNFCITGVRIRGAGGAFAPPVQNIGGQSPPEFSHDSKQ